jgi:hypothetical protein
MVASGGGFMKPSLRPPVTPSKLSESVHRHLSLYALAATAAGVGLLALAEPSEAKIIYTKTHQVIGTNGFYGLDLNHDGIIDFLIQERGYPFSSSGSNGLGAKEAFGNGVRGNNFLAFALSKGAPIGPRQNFINTTNSFGEVMFQAGCSADGGCSTEGQWNGVSNRYLGLKFQIGEKTHYGWARLNVAIQAGHNIVATLTGYAYETVGNKTIRAGQTSGDTVATLKDRASAEAGISNSSVPPVVPPTRFQQSSSLGRLALGAGYVPLRRQP